jgi:hypothetical protein
MVLDLLLLVLLIQSLPFPLLQNLQPAWNSGNAYVDER